MYSSYKFVLSISVWLIMVSFDQILCSQEFPNVRYQAPKSSKDAMTVTTFREVVPTKLAALVWNFLMKYKATLPTFPQQETCELLIVDRSIDQV